jgi:hypothetical protein
MRQRRQIPDGQGVSWRDPDEGVLVVWTFREHAMTMDRSVRIEELTGDGTRAIAHTGEVLLKPWGVYRLMCRE